jgi:hypothetical protein
MSKWRRLSGKFDRDFHSGKTARYYTGSRDTVESGMSVMTNFRLPAYCPQNNNAPSKGPFRLLMICEIPP